MRWLCLILIVAGSLGADWPHWRGPQHTGISSERGWSTRWPADGLRRLWTAEVGTGFSSVSVSGGRVITAGHVEENDIVWCFDERTGRELWRYGYPCSLVDNLHEGGPAATPTIDGDRVYTLSKEGQLDCLDVNDGKPLWTKRLSASFGVEMPVWGFSCSPYVLGERLILDAGSVVALDKRTGATIWQTEPFLPGYGSPTIFSRGGETLIAVLNNQCLLVVRAEDGREVARYPWETSFATSSTTPIVDGERIFLTTGYNQGCVLLEWSGNSLHRVYEHRDLAAHMATPVLLVGKLYGIHGNSHSSRTCLLKCLDLATGEEHWSERGFGCGTVLAADGKLLVLSEEGELVCGVASPERFEVLGRAQVLEGRCWTVPVLANGRLWCRNAAGSLVCLDLTP